MFNLMATNQLKLYQQFFTDLSTLHGDFFKVKIDILG